jgi:hypothetical protein
MSKKLINYDWRSGQLLKEVADGKNVFYIDNESTDVRVLSKDVAMGGDIVSALHCGTLSKFQKLISDKVGKGCRCTVSFEF